jgi:hypothetical protein
MTIDKDWFTCVKYLKFEWPPVQKIDNWVKNQNK